MGLWAYALSTGKGTNANIDTKAAAEIRKRSVAAARMLVERTRGNPYHVSMQPRDYVWGSNGVAAEYGVCLLIANLFQPDAAFVDTARDNLHYLLGRNTFSLSWVTQVGEHPYEHPHHRPSEDGKHDKPWPGLLSGGPNKDREDEIWRRFRRVWLRRKSTRIDGSRTQAMRFASTGRHRWSSCWLVNCNRDSRSQPPTGDSAAVCPSVACMCRKSQSGFAKPL